MYTTCIAWPCLPGPSTTPSLQVRACLPVAVSRRRARTNTFRARHAQRCGRLQLLFSTPNHVAALKQPATPTEVSRDQIDVARRPRRAAGRRATA